MEANAPLDVKDVGKSSALDSPLCAASASQSESIAQLVDLRMVLLKRIFDWSGALVLIITLSPFLAFIGLTIALMGRGSVLFSQLRVGRKGRLFRCYKFRTMIPDAESELANLLCENSELRKEWETTQKLRNDPRITSVGVFLRKTSLDELPQLINVLLGDMSLVGPRPALPDQLKLYGRSAKWYCAVPPGMTGLWQVTARGNQDFRRRIALDCYYVRHMSLAMDMRILLRTVVVVLSGRGAY